MNGRQFMEFELGDADGFRNAEVRQQGWRRYDPKEGGRYDPKGGGSRVESETETTNHSGDKVQSNCRGMCQHDQRHQVIDHVPRLDAN